jgi:hypothetical protein
MDTCYTEKEMKYKLKMDAMEIGVEDERRLNTAEDYAQWSTLVLSVWKLGKLQLEPVNDSVS